MFEQITAISAVAGSLVAIVVFVKGSIELMAMPRVALRADYNFAHEFAERCGDANAKGYAKELGYKALVNDGNLDTEQRKAILRLPNGVKTVPKYLTARNLLVVQVNGPILRWRIRRHSVRWYRRLLVVLMFTLYLVLAMVGLPAIFGPYPKTEMLALDVILALPPVASIFLVFLASLCMVKAIKLGVAASLVTLAATQVQLPDDSDTRD